MPVNYQNVCTASWLPGGRDASVIGRYRALAFPEQWRDCVLELCNAGRDEDAEPWRTAPTRALEQAIQAYAPDVLVMPRPFGARTEGDPARWLYADADIPDPLPTEVLATLIAHWLRDLRPEPEHRGLLRQTRAELTAHTPQWEAVERELVACDRTAGGTAAPGGHQFTLTPDWLARRILDLGPYPFEGGSLHFRAMPRGPRDKGAELVSQPLPHDAGGSKGVWWFSIVLNITLHTAPFDPLPRYHLHWSIRRWATRVSPASGRLRLPYGSRTSVLLRPRVPVLPGVPLSERFAVAQLERYRDRDTGTFSDRWAHGGPARLLGGVVLGEQLPGADDLLTDPEKWLADGARAGIVFRTAMGRHEVAAGLMPDQVSRLTEWAGQAVPGELRIAPPHQRVGLTGKRPLNAPPTNVKPDEKETEEARRTSERRRATALAVSAYGGPVDGGRPVLELQLVWQNAGMRQTAITALVELLGLPGPVDADAAAIVAGTDETAHRDARADRPVVLKWSTPELVVRLNCFRPVHRRADGSTVALTDGLELPAGAAERKPSCRRPCIPAVGRQPTGSGPSRAVNLSGAPRRLSHWWRSTGLGTSQVPTTTRSSLSGSDSPTRASSPSSSPSPRRSRATTPSAISITVPAWPGTTDCASSARGCTPSSGSTAAYLTDCAMRPCGWSAGTAPVGTGGPRTFR